MHYYQDFPKMASFLPSNVTLLMNQGILESLKQLYSKSFLETSCLGFDNGEFLQGEHEDKIATHWDKISADTICKIKSNVTEQNPNALQKDI